MGNKVNKDQIVYATELLLDAIEPNPEREGLIDTPRRVADWWAEFIDYTDPNLSTAFSINVDQMVVVRDMRVWSLCEHHLLPFWADISVGYITEGTILGLSKLGRIAQAHAHKLQIQERLVHNIADDIQRYAKTENVAVLAKGQHLCMVMRGIKQEHTMVTSVMRGAFEEQASTRAEFLRIING